MTTFGVMGQVDPGKGSGFAPDRTRSPAQPAAVVRLSRNLGGAPSSLDASETANSGARRAAQKILKMRNGSGLVTMLPAPTDSLAGAAWWWAERVAAASPWWSRSEALECLLTGIVPFPGVSVTVGSSVVGGPAPITLVIRAAATITEVADAYRSPLEAVGRRPPREPSATSVALCQLMSETIDWSWRERWNFWSRWREEDDLLAPILGAHGLATFRTTCRRALGMAFGPKLDRVRLGKASEQGKALQHD